MKTDTCFARSATWGAVLGLSLFSAQIKGVTVYTLPPGGNILATSSFYPVGVGLPLSTANSPFNAGVISGTLVSDVYSGDTSNPYGGLTFTYQLSLAPGSPDSSSEITVSSFSSFQTDVSFNTNGLPFEVKPSNFTRNGGAGDTVRFVFLTQSILPGQTGALLVVQTDATAFHPTMAGIIDGLTVNVPSLAPIAVPEPGLSALLVAGISALAFRLRRRS